MNSLIHVSIIVPMYNVSMCIERCVSSIFEQTKKDNIEYIFIDDASIDNSLEILNNLLEKYPERKIQSRIIPLPNNIGIGGVRELGIREANGEYLIHIDSDDYCDRHMISLMYEEALKYNADIVLCDNYVIRKNGIEHLHQFPKNNNPSREEMLIQAIGGADSLIPLWKRMVRKSLWIKENLNLSGINSGEDRLLGVIAHFNAENVAYIPKPLYYYNTLNSSSISHHYSLHKVFNTEKAYNMILSFLSDKDVEVKYKKHLNTLFWRLKFSILLLPEPNISKFQQFHSELNQIRMIIHLPFSIKRKLATVVALCFPVGLSNNIFKFPRYMAKNNYELAPLSRIRRIIQFPFKAIAALNKYMEINTSKAFYDKIPLAFHPCNLEKIETDCPIWFMWWQGLEKAPTIVKLAYASVLKHKGNHSVYLITEANINNFRDDNNILSWDKRIDSYINNGLKLAHYADIFRNWILYNKGGIWIDATCVLNTQIDDIITNNNFFSIKASKKYRGICVSGYRWSTFFIASGKHNPLHKSIFEALTFMLFRDGKFHDYLAFDYIWARCYDVFPQVKKMIDNIEPINFDIHKNVFNMEKSELNSIYKTTYRNQFQNYTSQGKQTNYGYLLKAYGINENTDEI